jgi:hypothetical protein
VVPIKVKKRIVAGINCRRIIIDPMMIKIHRDVPASFQLKLFANTGVAIRIAQPAANTIIEIFLVLDITSSPFLLGSLLCTAFHVPTLNQNPLKLNLLNLLYLFRFSLVNANRIWLRRILFMYMY